MFCSGLNGWESWKDGRILRWWLLGFTLKLHFLPRGDGGSSWRAHLAQVSLLKSRHQQLASISPAGTLGISWKFVLTSYLFWSSAAFLIHMIFSFFSMVLQATSMAFWAFGRSFCKAELDYIHLWKTWRPFKSSQSMYLKSGQVVSNNTLLPNVLSSLGWIWKTTSILLLLLLRFRFQD